MTARSVQIARSIGLIGVTGALVLGATFAAVGDKNNANLTANTLAVTAGLQIALENAGNPGTFGLTAPGFNLTDVRFGAEKVAGNIYLKSTATADQTVSLNVPVAPTLTGVTADKVHVRIKKGDQIELDATLEQLETPAGASFANPLPAGNATGEKFTLAFMIDPVASGVTASVPSFDLNFTGTEQ